MKRWNYGTYHELTIRHPVGDKLPLLGPYFNVGPAGDERIIHHHQADDIWPGAVDALRRRISATGIGSLNNITIGESGQILSRHYKDQWERTTPAAVFRCSSGTWMRSRL